MTALNRLLCGAGTCQDLLSCVYNLNKLECEAYFVLLEGHSRMDELVDALDRERSTVYRAVQKLVGHQLAMRDTVSLDGGGYCHVYRPVDPTIVDRRVRRWVEDLSTMVEGALDTFQDEAERRRDAPSGSGPGDEPSPVQA